MEDILPVSKLHHKNIPDPMNLRDALRAIGIVSLLTASSAAHGMNVGSRSLREDHGETFAEFIARARAIPDTALRRQAVSEFVIDAAQSGRASVEDTTVSFFYLGVASRVGVPSDLNRWDPAADTMRRMEGTNFFYLSKIVDKAARFEYKLSVDSTWILDPYNSRQTMGGFGPNSEIWMPGYAPPLEIVPRTGIQRGTVDTIAFVSRILGRTHPVFIYLPAAYRTTRKEFPVIYVLDGGDYLSLGLMNTVMDNLIADGLIEPVVGVFVDPRTDVRDTRTSTRMKDYMLDEKFLDALTKELRPVMMRRLRLRKEASQTAIMGASLGGLFATYAAFSRPRVFGLCAAQSPSYWVQEGRIIREIGKMPRKPVRVYLDTGTIRDAEKHARIMRDLLQSKGYPLHYEEHSESHNWTNWRARIGSILMFFWGRR